MDISHINITSKGLLGQPFALRLEQTLSHVRSESSQPRIKKRLID